jgi:peptidoglycan/xylan/chitin deacetylase (PgdA/CDA1 family)
MDKNGFANSTSDVMQRSPRAIARHATLTTLSGLWRSRGRIERALQRPRVHFLFLHHVFPDEEVQFRKLLQILAKNHTFISYSEAVERSVTGRIDRPYMAFSMDDGFKNCCRAAAVLTEFGARGCFFLITSMVGERDPEKIREFCATKLALPPVEFMTWNDVELLRRHGHEIGSHSLSHARLSTLTQTQLEDEIGASEDVLRRTVGEARHFAWPYGSFADISSEAVDAVFKAGFSSLASGVRGCHISDEAPGRNSHVCIRRDLCEPHWPVEHTLYFLATSSAKASKTTALWPYSIRKNLRS